MPRAAVTPDDLALSVRLATDVLSEVPEQAWRSRAGTLEWDLWETVEHLSDDLFSYAVQLAPARPSTDQLMPFLWQPRREGGPWNAVHADPDAGPAGLLRTLEATAALLVAMVRARSPNLRSYHAYGASDPEGFTAMGIVETLVHTHDAVDGLGLSWRPPSQVCARVLDRLFPDAPSGDRWSALLWSTGRADLPGRARLTSWRWDGTPRGPASVGELEAHDAGDQAQQQGELER